MSLDRYHRQYLFHGLGLEGQKRLLSSSVLIAGCGGLGTHLSMTLTRAGIGTIRLIDFDGVDQTNLARQILYTEQDAKEKVPKAQAAAKILKSINSEIRIEPFVETITLDSLQRIGDVDLILDATDNFETRFLINEYSIRSKIPWIYAGVVESRATSLFIEPGKTPCLRCIIPETPSKEEAPGCDLVGVLEPAIASIAAWQSTLALQYLSGAREQVNGELFSMDLWEGTFRKIPVERFPRCSHCNHL